MNRWQGLSPSCTAIETPGTPAIRTRVIRKRLNYCGEFLCGNKGYVNLRCRWNPGCPSGVQIHQEKSKEQSSYEAVFEDSWKSIFQNSDVPEVVGSGCCAQFAVSKQRIRARSHGFYVHLRKWLLNTNLDDATSGRVMEYLWHIIFGAPAVK